MSRSWPRGCTLRLAIVATSGGELQTLSGSALPVQILAVSGQVDRLLEGFESVVSQGRFGRAANNHVEWSRDLLGGDLRYQALLEEAGITW